MSQRIPLPIAISKEARWLAVTFLFHSDDAIHESNGSELFPKPFGDLMVDELATLVEYYVDLVAKGVGYYQGRAAPRLAKAIAPHVFLANWYRQRFHEVAGTTADDRHVPFENVDTYRWFKTEIDELMAKDAGDMIVDLLWPAMRSDATETCPHPAVLMARWLARSPMLARLDGLEKVTGTCWPPAKVS